MNLKYRDRVVLYNVIGEAYGKNKTVVSAEYVPSIFLQNITLTHTNNQEMTTGDSICYIDPKNSYVRGLKYQLEGMYLRSQMYSIANDDQWYRVLSVTINRNHLLGDKIDNIVLSLMKVAPLPNVS